MTRLLHIDSSARIAGSITRDLTAEFATQWKSVHPDGQVVNRDIGVDPIPHLMDATVAAMFVPPAVRNPKQVEATALQEELIAELASVDTVVIGVPMYNLDAQGVDRSCRDLWAHGRHGFI